MMKSLDELIAKLDKIAFDKEDRHNNIIYCADGTWKVSYTVKTLTSLADTMTFQAVVRVTYKGEEVARWGCVTENENRWVVLWFTKSHNKIYEEELSIQREIEKQATAVFNSL